jgi:hypothetical protein
MRHLARRFFLFLGMTICFVVPAGAQGPPPPIGPFAVDAHVSIPSFPSDSTQLAQSHGLCASPDDCQQALASLPGRGWGGQLGAHFYFARWKAVTFGIGGELMVARATSTPAAGSTGIPLEERLVSASPQLSFNFGTGNGWSYISGGIGRSVWALHETGLQPSAVDVEPLLTVNYGGGARWFIKKHLAFSLDVRWYEIHDGTPIAPLPGSPRTTLMIVGAGVSLK